MAVLLVSLSSFFKRSGDDKALAPLFKVEDTVRLVDIARKPNEPKPKPEIQKPIATIKNPPPLIVPDNVPTDPIPTVDDLEGKKMAW